MTIKNAGLVGTGKWARAAHIPVLQYASEMSLTGIWGRNTKAVRSIAAEASIRAFRSYEELLRSCDLVSYAVPPSVQAGLAIRAARSGKSLVLDKPLAENLADASALYEAIAESGCPSVMMLLFEYLPQLQALRRAHLASPAVDVCIRMAVPIASGWRSGLDPWLEAGTHFIHIAEHILGPALSAEHTGSGGRISVSITHLSGLISHCELILADSLSPADAKGNIVTVDGSGRTRVASLFFHDFDSALRKMARHLSGVMSGEPSDLSADYGLHVQTLL